MSNADAVGTHTPLGHAGATNRGLTRVTKRNEVLQPGANRGPQGPGTSASTPAAEPTRTPQEPATRSRSVVAFLAVAFAWAWGWWGLTILLPKAPATEVTTFLGTCAPLVAAWANWWRTDGAAGAWRRVGRCLRPTGGWKTWVLPSLAVLAVLGAASWVQHRWSEAPPPAPALWLLAPQLMIMLTVGGGQEEIGWRGWLHPRLRTEFGRWTTPLLVGSLWFCWHLPLWWMSGSIQVYIPMVTFAMMTIGLFMLMARALETTRGGTAVAIWLHALNNLAAGWLVFITPEADIAQPGAWAMGIGYLVAGVVAMAIPPAAKQPSIPPSTNPLPQ